MNILLDKKNSKVSSICIIITVVELISGK